MNKNIQILQDTITPEITGIFWITSTPLTDRPKPFEAIDYFLDGLLTQYVKHVTDQVTDSNTKNFFACENFGKQFFVGHLLRDSKNIEHDFREIISLTKALDRTEKQVAVIDFESDKYIQILKSKYPDFNFFKVDIN